MTQQVEPKRKSRGPAMIAAVGLAAIVAGGAGYAFWPAGEKEAPPPLGFADGADAAWRRFAVASPALYDDIGKPLIALVIAPPEHGPSGAVRSAESLEAPVTLVLREGGAAAHAARERGHEALLELGSAGIAGDPARDAAAIAGARVQSGLAEEENASRMETSLSAQGDGYVGVAILDDAAAGRDPKLLRSVLTTARERGLLVLNAKPGAGAKGYLVQRRLKAPPATVDVLVDLKREPAAMARALRLAEETAAQRGTCVILARAHPETLSAIKRWLKNRRGGAEIVPLSAVVATRLRKG